MNDKNPWVGGNLVLDKAILEDVYAHAREGYARDEESCGLLFGPASDALFVGSTQRFVNRANKLHELDPERYPRTGRMYFDIDPLKFDRAVREGAASGAPAKVLYHSHLDVGAYFSETDATSATMGGDSPTYELAYLVVSVRAGEVDDAKLFIWSAASRTFVPSSFTVKG
ncbi:Mov34/MPN/PAD-1 family protein [Pendulispora albinea]|uniref:Mov34/MPN/PAD-1 family protein n=1 Tax=Pendulispora albinea TaxID=2741071 RepID=A0ABZ2M4L3_9BACT